MATAKKKEELKETEVPQENETIITKKSESKNKEDNKPLARKDLRKLITNDLEIVIMNNTNNKFTYECPRTHRSYDMTSYGDLDYITYEELNAMKNKYRIILQDYWILPIDVISDDVTLEDVLQFAGLKDIYKAEMLQSDFIDELLINKDINEFMDIMQKVTNKYILSIVDRAVALFKENKFNDYSKMSVLENKVQKPDLFKEISEQIQEQ
ncbi:hypothetical protein ADU90_06380 (plasmid) [Clostridium botulinum]|uniref:Uncharacterized protein n=2 Tax=Clostridium botulinum TaxID=1491 RepID=A0A0A0HXU9_CLOBO|nr:hypothetical protein [Clostridium botulinum]KGM93362.1 hypothetical protein Z955_15430 [Clostridium botulinum C/D str. DC5]KOC56955.1 hypothetical protein ADU89_01840 [Clostridium botulinum]KOC57430.1 hypothetical protein ADU90_06380 [Clostridium botulinum]MCD3232673.1 hypothetical protein [Clostridium botulinum D/C]MCD3238397.1 hypothetical protein [Clostridium botulinum D/C]